MRAAATFGVPDLPDVWIKRLQGCGRACLAVAVLCAAWPAVAAPSPAPTAAQTAQRNEARIQRSEALQFRSGSYLAATNAQGNRDMRAAAEFFRALIKSDPDNQTLIDRAFIVELSDGNFTEAFRLADRLVSRNATNPLARVTLAVRAIKQRQFQRARKHLDVAGGGRGRRTDLTIALLTAWTHVGAGDVKKALELVDQFNAPELAAYRNFFGGLMADVAGNKAEAEKRLTAAYRIEPGTLRVADAFARLQSRLGNRDDAIKVYEAWQARNQGQPFVRRQLDDLKAGRALPPLSTTVTDGAAEVLYGLGAVSTTGRESETALIFMQLAAYLNPDDDLVRVSIGELFESMRQWERSGEAFARIGSDSPFRSRSLLGRVIAYERQDKSDEAIRTLTTLLEETPDEFDAVDMLGGLYRTKKRYAESIGVYSRAIDRIPKPEQSHWTLFFGRAVAYERDKQWPKAEADFLTALKLLPASVRTPRQKYERAQVLNYLAYSWVDQKLNIERSFDMLKEAVALAPDDGAIVDSLGWAYYRLDKFEDAVRELERAVALKPGDATINDHLGDAYWRVGRKREAYFKWNHARDLKPEAEELPKILSKLERGLDDPWPGLPPELAPPGLPAFDLPPVDAPPVDLLPFKAPAN